MSDSPDPVAGPGTPVTTPQSQPVAETPDNYGAYPRLSEVQIEALAVLGSYRQTEPGEILFREGDGTCDFFVVRTGKAAVLEGYGTAEERMISVHGAGRFLGELSLLTGETMLVTTVMLEPGQVLAVPVNRLRELVARDSALGDLILRAYLLRRSNLIGIGAGVRIVGSRYSPDARRLRDFAARNRLPHRWRDLEEDHGAEQLLRQLGITPEETPVVILYGRRLLRNPSNAELAATLGLLMPAAQTACDLAVVGAGPAGLAAAVYGASEGLATIAFDGIATGGQAGTSPRIENYLGFPSGISGAELAERAVIQARKFGAGIRIPAEAVAIAADDGHYAIELADQTVVLARIVLISTGARYRRLSVPDLDKFEGTSVYYAATQVEAQLCRNDPVAVVGGGNSAGQASLFLAQHAPVVFLLVRGGDLSASMSRYLIDQIERNDRVRVMLHTEVSELRGGQALESLVAVDNRTGDRHKFPARALFVFIGAKPHTGWLQGQISLDDHGFIRTGADAARFLPPDAAPDAAWRPMLLETSRPGVFAAGDVRSGSVKRVASAVGEGAMAVRMVHERMSR